MPVASPHRPEPPRTIATRWLVAWALWLTVAACAHGVEVLPDSEGPRASFADVERGVRLDDEQPSGIWSDRWITPSAYAHYIQARIHQESERPDLALENIRLALAFDPDSAHLYAVLAELRLADDDLPGAEAALADAFQHDPDSPWGHFIQARIHQKREDWPAAAASAARAIELDPTSSEAYFDLARLRIQLEDVPGAIQTVEAIIARWPLDPRAHILLGKLAEDAGDLDRAAEAYQEVIDLRPRSTTGYTRLADVRIRQERLQDAWDTFVECTDACVHAPSCWFRRVRVAQARASTRTAPALAPEVLAELDLMAEALASDPEQASVIASRLLAIDDEPLLLAFVQACARRRPNLTELYHYLGLLYQRLDRDRDAVAAFRRVPLQSRFAMESRAKLAITLSELGRHREAVAAIDDAITHEPELVELWSLKGALLERAGRLDLAVHALERAAQLVPDRPELLYRLAAVAWKRRDGKTTVGALERVIELSPRDPTALNFLGSVLAETGDDLARAERLVRQALDIEANDALFIDSLGSIQLRMGRTAEAVETLRTAAELLPTEPSILEHLGDAYAADGQHEMAVTSYQDALQLVRDRGGRAQLQRKLRKLGGRATASRP